MTREQVKIELYKLILGQKKIHELSDELFMHDDIVEIFNEIKAEQEGELINEDDYQRDMQDGLI